MPTITFTNEDGEEIQIPAKYEVCDRCHGEGHHTNPAIDGNGITQSEMEELGDDFREDYLSGVYDIPCDECYGKRVILEEDRENVDPEILRQYDAYISEKIAYEAEKAAERRWGY